jgi:hypothetical protein
MSEICFHDKVITPNGPGIVQGLLTQNGRESILISHDPKDEKFKEVYGSPLLPGEHQSVWVLYAYAPGKVQPAKGGK